MIKFLLFLFAFLALAISGGLAGIAPSTDMIMDVTENWMDGARMEEDDWHIN